jgi:hypothetical protein
MIFAVIADSVISALVQATLLGPVVVWFMLRDNREREQKARQDEAMAKALLNREEALARSLAEREEKQDARNEAMLDAIHHLIRITGIEVMTRPEAVERAKRDADEILRAISVRK